MWSDRCPTSLFERMGRSSGAYGLPVAVLVTVAIVGIAGTLFGGPGPAGSPSVTLAHSGQFANAQLLPNAHFAARADPQSLRASPAASTSLCPTASGSCALRSHERAETGGSVASFPAAGLTAGIRATPGQGIVVLEVKFTGIGQGGITTVPYDFTWNFSDGTPVVTVNETGAEVNDTIFHNFTQVGTYLVNLTVQQVGSAKVAFAHVSIPVAAPLSIVASANPPAISLGNTSVLTPSASGGFTPYTYTWSNVPLGCKQKPVTLTCTPTETGTYEITALVVDLIGDRASTLVNLTVYLIVPPLGLTVSAVPQAITLGETSILTAAASGGLQPYTYFWIEQNTGCHAKISVLTCTPTTAGPYSITAQVTDSLGNRLSTEYNITVNPRLSIHATVTTQYVCTNGSAVVEANLTGNASLGTPPLAYLWNPGDGSPSISVEAATHNYSLGSGSYIANFTVTDSTGATASFVATVTTSFPNCNGSGTAPEFGPPPIIVVALTAVGVVVAVLVYLNIRSMRRTPPRAAPEPPSSASEGGLSPEPAPEPVPEEPAT